MIEYVGNRLIWFDEASDVLLFYITPYFVETFVDFVCYNLVAEFIGFGLGCLLCNFLEVYVLSCEVCVVFSLFLSLMLTLIWLQARLWLIASLW